MKMRNLLKTGALLLGLGLNLLGSAPDTVKGEAGVEEEKPAQVYYVPLIKKDIGFLARGFNAVNGSEFGKPAITFLRGGYETTNYEAYYSLEQENCIPATLEEEEIQDSGMQNIDIDSLVSLWSHWFSDSYMISVPTVTDKENNLYAKLEEGKQCEMESSEQYFSYQVRMCSELEVFDMYEPRIIRTCPKKSSDYYRCSGIEMNGRGISEVMQLKPETKVMVKVLDSSVSDKLYMATPYQEVYEREKIISTYNKFKQNASRQKNIPVLFLYKFITPSQVNPEKQIQEPVPDPSSDVMGASRDKGVQADLEEHKVQPAEQLRSGPSSQDKGVQTEPAEQLISPQDGLGNKPTASAQIQPNLQT